MNATETKVDMAELKEAVRILLAFKPPSKPEQKQQRVQRKPVRPQFAEESEDTHIPTVR